MRHAVETARDHRAAGHHTAGVNRGCACGNLRAIAAAAHVTPAHLVRRFRAELGITPVAYLWQRRVATAIELLTNTGLPVGEIASRAGFRSVYHLSRRVKDHTGAAPTQLRRQRWLGRR